MRNVFAIAAKIIVKINLHYKLSTKSSYSNYLPRKSDKFYVTVKNQIVKKDIANVLLKIMLAMKIANA